MKVIIQDNESRKYLTPDRTWTANLDAANDFRLDAIARRALGIAKAGKLHVVYYFEELNYLIAARTWGGNFKKIQENKIMHAVLIINSILQWSFGIALGALLILWVFEIKLLSK